MRDFVIVTCEHGGNRIPPRYAPLFRGQDSVLRTHLGYDAGALAMARDLADSLHAPLVSSTVSRLLVDLNRSLTNRHAWSEATRSLPATEKAMIVRKHYVPHHHSIAAIVDNAIAAGKRVVHIASHSFTPVLDGQVRTADIGLLYDPARAGEVELAERWQSALAGRDASLRVRRNYPYAGKGDGLTRSLRWRLRQTRYVGIELEINQSFVLAGGKRWRDLRESVVATLGNALDRRSRRSVPNLESAAQRNTK